jgi:hypothetical protein
MIRHMAAKGMTAKDIAGLTGLAEEESSQVGEIVWCGALFIRKFSKEKESLSRSEVNGSRCFIFIQLKTTVK